MIFFSGPTVGEEEGREAATQVAAIFDTNNLSHDGIMYAEDHWFIVAYPEETQLAENYVQRIDAEIEKYGWQYTGT